MMSLGKKKYIHETIWRQFAGHAHSDFGIEYGQSLLNIYYLSYQNNYIFAALFTPLA